MKEINLDGEKVIIRKANKFDAKELIEYLINWSKDSGIIRKINLRVRSDNIIGIQLYR